MPATANVPHFMDHRLHTAAQNEYGETLKFTAESNRARYDHSVAENCDVPISYPLGFRDEQVSLGFRDQTLPRNPTRGSDVEEAFDDGKCPIGLCQAQYVANTSSTRLVRHLMRHHLTELAPTFIPVPSQREFERDLQAWAISAKFSPLKFEDDQFRAIVLKYTSMEPKSSNTFRRRLKDLVDDAYADLQILVKRAYSKKCFVTMDEWSSSTRDYYLGVLVAFIDRETKSTVEGRDVVRMQVKRRLIGYKLLKRGTALDLASVARSLLDGAGLTDKDVIGMITDNCNTMKSMSSLAHRLRIPCMAHLIQSAVETLWTPKTTPQTASRRWNLDQGKYRAFQFAISCLITRIRTLFNWIHASSSASKSFERHQEKNGRKALKVHLDVITRWNSVREMIDRCMERIQELDSMWYEYCTEHKVFIFPFLNPSEFRLLCALQIVLQHASRVQESLCEDGPTLPRVLPSMYRLATTLRVARSLGGDLNEKPFQARPTMPTGPALQSKTNEKSPHNWVIWDHVPKEHILRTESVPIGSDVAVRLIFTHFWTNSKLRALQRYIHAYSVPLQVLAEVCDPEKVAD